MTELERNRMEEMVRRLNEASEAYYGGRDEIMSNFEWDALFDELTRLEEETGVILPDSPTQKVNTASEDNIAGEKETHEYPALSLAKTKKVEDLQEWAGDRPVWLSWKLDGLTLVLTYDGGRLSRILTRGNGSVGTNITFMKTAIRGIPAEIEEQGHLVVRGEATISYPDFEKLNETISDPAERFANPRNLASGTLALDALGFITVDRELTDAEGLPATVEKWTRRVESGEMQIPVDGLVICYDDTVYAATGSVTGHHATRAGYAFKWQDESALTTLREVEWSCGATVITPIGDHADRDLRPGAAGGDDGIPGFAGEPQRDGPPRHRGERQNRDRGHQIQQDHPQGGGRHPRHRKVYASGTLSGLRGAGEHRHGTQRGPYAEVR